MSTEQLQADGDDAAEKLGSDDVVLAPLKRRTLALMIDWGISVTVSMIFFGYDALANVMIFLSINIIFIPTIGGTIGHRLMGLWLVSVQHDGWVGVVRPSIRTFLLCCVIPALIWDSDQRGFHDKIAGTKLVQQKC